MSLTKSLSLPSRSILIIDLLLLVALCLIPVLSHLSGISFKYAEPMRIALFTGMLLVPDKRNAYILAVLFPLFSMFTTGMPIPVVCGMMIIELIANVFIYYWLYNKKKINSFFALLISILGAKVIFHIIKWIVVSFALMNSGVLVGEWKIQLAASLLLAVIFSLAITIKKK